MSTAVLGIRLVLAGVFVLASVGKLLDLEGSRRAMRDFGVPAGFASAAGVLLPLAELATAVALVLSASARWGAVAALILLLSFIAGIANALRKGLAPDCHCFGQIHSAPASRTTLARNGALAALAGVVAVYGNGPAIDDWVAARTGTELVAVALGIAAVLFGAGWLQMWLQRRTLMRDLTRAQRQALSAPPGVPIGTHAPRFNLSDLSGNKVSLDSLRERGRPLLLTFVSPWCGSCMELLPQLRRWQATLAERVTIVVISTGKVKDNVPLAEKHGLEHVLLQEQYEVSDAYRLRGTPTGIIVTADGKVGSNPAESVFEMEPLIRLALRDGADAQIAQPVAS